MSSNKPSESHWNEHSLDAALSEMHHEVPDDFSNRVMHSLASPAPKPLFVVPPLSKLQWCALLGGGLLGLGQIARVIFGLWFAAAAW